MWRIPLIILALLGPFFFPWQFALILGILVSFVAPFTILLVGVLLDTLYFGGVSTGSLPYFTIIGIIFAGICLAVQQFVKTRII
jgi:hypothetical protein